MSRLAIVPALVLVLALGLSACNKPAVGGEGAKNLAEAKAFLEKNGKAPGVKTTASGLEYKVLSSGPATGPQPKKSDEVKVNYEGKLLDGTVFDSSYKDGTPTSFFVGQVVPGWTEVLQLMRPGDVWEVYLPPQLGYGESGMGGAIPPNAALTFKIELLDVFQHPG